MEIKKLNRHERRRRLAVQRADRRRKAERNAYIELQREQGWRLAHDNKLAAVATKKEARRVKMEEARTYLINLLATANQPLTDPKDERIRKNLVAHIHQKLNRKEF
jgi:hypothetical protein